MAVKTIRATWAPIFAAGEGMRNCVLVNRGASPVEIAFARSAPPTDARPRGWDTFTLPAAQAVTLDVDFLADPDLLAWATVFDARSDAETSTLDVVTSYGLPAAPILRPSRAGGDV